MTTISIERLNNNIRLPEQAHAGDVGYDVFAPFDIEIPVMGNEVIDLGFRMKLSGDFFVMFVNKSGLASKSIIVGACLIDIGYRGEVKLNLINISSRAKRFKAGDKIGQFIIKRHYPAKVEEVFEINNNTSRGSGGFGSTG